jgi:GMP synthase-like glutamine amidotransferase
MKRFLVVQHTYSEYLGTIEKQLEGRGIGFVYVRPFTGQALPGGALNHDALWLLGGAWPVTDRENVPWLDSELRLIAAFRRARRPAVGFGFGALLLAQAAGGVASAEPAQRAYWTTAHRVRGGESDPVAAALDGRRVLVMVNGRAGLPSGVAPLAVDDSGDWIAFRVEHGYGLLCRPEVKPGMIEDMIMEEGRPLPENVAELLDIARSEWPQTQRTTENVLAALVTALDLMRERHKMPVFALRTVKDEG